MSLGVIYSVSPWLIIWIFLNADMREVSLWPLLLGVHMSCTDNVAPIERSWCHKYEIRDNVGDGV